MTKAKLVQTCKLFSLSSFSYVGAAADVEKTAEDIERAFKVFEKESEKSHGQAGTVNLKVLRQALTTLGDKLTPQEMEFFVNAADNKASLDFASFMVPFSQILSLRLRSPILSRHLALSSLSLSPMFLSEY